jgi:hypothetical protein
MSIQLSQSRTVTGHSSDVTMSLHIESAKLRVVQSSANAIKLMSAEPVPAGDAMLETIVDGRIHRRLIRVLSDSPRPNWVSIEDRSL